MKEDKDRTGTGQKFFPFPFPIPIPFPILLSGPSFLLERLRGQSEPGAET